MWRRHVCYVCKRSVCGGDEPQPVAHLSHKLQCARQSLKIMVSYGNKYPRHNARPHVVEQSGQCARALIPVGNHYFQALVSTLQFFGSSVRQAVARPATDRAFAYITYMWAMVSRYFFSIFVILENFFNSCQFTSFLLMLFNGNTVLLFSCDWRYYNCKKIF